MGTGPDRFTSSFKLASLYLFRSEEIGRVLSRRPIYHASRRAGRRVCWTEIGRLLGSALQATAKSQRRRARGVRIFLRKRPHSRKGERTSSSYMKRSSPPIYERITSYGGHRRKRSLSDSAGGRREKKITEVGCGRRGLDFDIFLERASVR